MTVVNEFLKQLELFDINMYNKDFLFTWDKTQTEIKATILVAEALQNLYANNISIKVFETGVAVSLFKDNSIGTNFSFASAAKMLGLSHQSFDEEKSQILHGENAKMFSFLTEVIGICDVHPLAGHSYMQELTNALQESYINQVLNQRPSVINLQCDVDHPTQVMADLMHLKKYFGEFENLHNKNMAITWEYSPSGSPSSSLPQGVIGLMTRMGMNVILAYPKGYDLNPDVVDIALNNATKYNGSFKIVNYMDEAFARADVVYSTNWAPYLLGQKKSELLEMSDLEGLKNLDNECLVINSKFKDWECTEQKMKLTKNASTLYMHCNKYQTDTHAEAGYKTFIIAAMILLSRFRDPILILSALDRNAKKQHLIIDSQ